MIKAQPIKKKIPAKVALVSCVGVLSENYPLSYGNYFSLYIPCECIQVCNFNYENFKESVKRFLTDKQVEVTIFENSQGWRFCAITDERIPEDWYSMWSDNQGYCNGGIHGEEYQEVARILGKRFGSNEDYVTKHKDESPDLTIMNIDIKEPRELKAKYIIDIGCIEDNTPHMESTVLFKDLEGEE